MHSHSTAMRAASKAVLPRAMSPADNPASTSPVPPVAVEYGAQLIGLTMAKEGIPVSAEARVSLALDCLSALSGTLLAMWSIDALGAVWRAPYSAGPVQMDGAVLAYSAAMTLATALLSLLALLITGILTPAEAFSGFSHPATISVAAVLVLSAAIEKTGVLTLIARRVLAPLGRSEWLLTAAVMLVIGLLSAFINNTAAPADRKSVV